MDHVNVPVLPEQRSSAGLGRDGGGNVAVLRKCAFNRHVNGAHEPNLALGREDGIRVHLPRRDWSVADDTGLISGVGLVSAHDVVDNHRSEGGAELERRNTLLSVETHDLALVLVLDVKLAMLRRELDLVETNGAVVQRLEKDDLGLGLQFFSPLVVHGERVEGNRLRVEDRRESHHLSVVGRRGGRGGGRVAVAESVGRHIDELCVCRLSVFCLCSEGW